MLVIKNLSAGYGEKIVLKDLNLTVNKGELAGIIGPNGSGKTTFLKTITQMVKPKKGSLHFESYDLTTAKVKDIARHIAVMPQAVEPPSITVEEFVLMGRIPYYRTFQFWESKSDREIAYRNMRLTDTYQFKDELIDEISGGEKQRCSIARALTQEPDLLLLDEPTSHLDITHQVKILNLIKKLNHTLGLTVITVLHDLNLASEYCSRLILINEGTIYTDGTPKEVLTSDNIQKVYHTGVSIGKNPFSHKPHIMIISEEASLKI